MADSQAITLVPAPPIVRAELARTLRKAELLRAQLKVSLMAAENRARDEQLLDVERPHAGELHAVG